MTKRLRIFAGPNGSGKSTITQMVGRRVHLGVYCNADEYKKTLTQHHEFDFAAIGLQLDIERLKNQIKQSSLANRYDANAFLTHVHGEGNLLKIDPQTPINDYFVTAFAEFIRNELLQHSEKFSFETVMSHPSKLQFMRQAKQLGFKTYLYFVALTNPRLNVKRVENRVQQGGHDVPEQKIRERYIRTMDQLFDALSIADRAYLFDNSGGEPIMVAEKADGQLQLLGTETPKWVQRYVLDKLELLGK